MKTTVFTEKHISLGAKMVPFAGYNMPVEYEGITAEHIHVREKVGVFDVSHMGEIWVKGPGAKAFLQYTTSNDVDALYPGKAQYSCFPNGKGGIVDDVIVYCFGEQQYLLVVNAANVDKDWAHLNSYKDRFEVTLENASDGICQLAVQGPLAMQVMQRLCKENIMDMEYYTFKVLEVAGIPEVILSTTGYTGSGGCEVYAPNASGLKLWDAIFEAGKPEDIKPIGLGARDTLRLEMGFCLYGNDIDDTTSPIEASLGWITKFSEAKGEFIDRALLLAQKEAPIARRLVGFELVDKGIARHGYPVCDARGNEIGTVTSGSMAPYLKKAIGMAYVAAPLHKQGSEIFINVRGRMLKAVVVRPPFYKK